MVVLTCSEQENHFLQTASVCTSHRPPHFFRWSTTIKETKIAQWLLARIISFLRRRPHVARYLSKTEIFQTYTNKSVSTRSVFEWNLPVQTEMRIQNDSKTLASTNSACARLRSLWNRGLAEKSAFTPSLFGFFLPRTKKSGSHLWSHRIRKPFISFVHTNLINLRFQKSRSGTCMKKNFIFGDRKRRHYTCGREKRVEISVFENDPD